MYIWSNPCLTLPFFSTIKSLPHWGRMTHICVSKLTIIDSANGLSPCRRQAIIWTNVGIWLIGPLGTNFSEILIEIYTFSFKEMHLKMSSEKRRPSCLSLNVLKTFHRCLVRVRYGVSHLSSVWFRSCTGYCMVVTKLWELIFRTFSGPYQDLHALSYITSYIKISLNFGKMTIFL